MWSWAPSVVAFVVAVTATTLTRIVTGVSLGLFIGGAAFVTLIVPPVTIGETTIRRRCLITVAASLGVAIVWLTAIGELLTLFQLQACVTALLAYAFALCGVCSLLLAMRFNGILAAGFVTTLGLLWLTWPVWLSHALLTSHGDALIGWLVPAHPLFAINGVLAHFGTWDRQPLAYNQLTVLNQHVFYDLPTSVLWATLVHGTIAALAMMLEKLIQVRRDSIPASPQTAVP